MTDAEFLECCLSLGIELTTAQLRQFNVFETNLYQANQVMNLTRVPQSECRLRHFVDSLLFHDLIPDGSRVLDIGAGAGFPAWPLACARPDLRVIALDSSSKMIGFLRRNALPNMELVQERAEGWGVRDAFDVVTGRAVAPLAVQLELSAAPLKVGGFVIPMRAASDLEAISKLAPSNLGLSLERVERRILPTTDIVRVFPVYRKVRATPARYPRSWAEIKRTAT